MHRGSTRAEVVTALCGVFVLLALLAVGVQRVREAAARMTCQNNLKQLGLAVQCYQDANGTLPPSTMPKTELPPDQRLSFLLTLLPFTESTNIYAKMELTAAWDSPTTNVSVIGIFTPKLYRCPAWAERQDVLPTGHLAVTNYVGVAGVGADAATRPADAPGIGVFGYDRTIKFADVKDGLDNTAMMLETSRDVGPWIRGGPSTLRPVDPEEAPLAGVGRPFGGTHRHGFNVLLADGSVRLTKSDVSAAVLGALATIAGGEQLPAEW
jgi:prepilin-type processing-associated H-X9-DG protein